MNWREEALLPLLLPLLLLLLLLQPSLLHTYNDGRESCPAESYETSHNATLAIEFRRRRRRRDQGSTAEPKQFPKTVGR